MISIIVPAYNEEKHIEATLKKLLEVSRKIKGEIIVVDDCSTDGTAKVAKKYATVFRNSRNLGKGAAMRIGAQKSRGDLLIFIDASQFDASEIPKLVAEMKKNKSKMVVGKRNLSKIPWPRKITNALTRLAILMGTGRTIKDPLSGFRILSKKDYLLLGTKENRYAIEAEINFRALLKKWEIAEVPVSVFYHGMPSMRLEGSKASFASFLNQRFLHESLFNIKSVLKVWLSGKL